VHDDREGPDAANRADATERSDPFWSSDRRAGMVRQPADGHGHGLRGVLRGAEGHRSIDFALSYRSVGFPVGMVVLVTAWGYLGTLWVRRQLRRS
jgi:hypothetical protein